MCQATAYVLCTACILHSEPAVLIQHLASIVCRAAGGVLVRPQLLGHHGGHVQRAQPPQPALLEHHPLQPLLLHAGGAASAAVENLVQQC